MDARTPHYLRFARTLALATTIALPACGDAGSPTDEGDPTAPAGAAAPETGAAPAARAVARAGSEPALSHPVEIRDLLPAPAVDAGADADVYSGHSSGPVPPPDMPASLV